MKAVDLFALGHAHVHAPADGGVYQPLVGLSEAQLRACPPGMNSLAWLLWHCARCEDVALGVLLAGRGQVIDEGEWSRRMGLDRRDIGTGMTLGEVRELSARVDLRALQEYHRAVGRRTRELVGGLDLEGALDRRLVDRAIAEGALGSNAAWVEAHWKAFTRWWCLLWLGQAHNHTHLGEMWVVRSQVTA